MTTQAARAGEPWGIGLGIGFGVMGHGIAWAAYALLGVTGGDAAPLPAWAALAMAFGGREWILAVFSLASMLPLYAGVLEHANEGRPRTARVFGLLSAAVAAALAVRWFEQGRPVLTLVAALLVIPGVVGISASPPRTPSDPTKP